MYKRQEEELAYIKDFCESRGCEFALAEVWEHGGQGGVELANKVLNILENKESNFKVLYPDEYTLKQKIETISKEIYGADGVTSVSYTHLALASCAKRQMASSTSPGATIIKSASSSTIITI